jgi:hypothetical protein
VGANGTHTTIHRGPPLVGPQCVVQDLANGHVVVGDFLGGMLFDVSLSGAITTLWKPANPNARFFSITQDHFDGSLLIGSGGMCLLTGMPRYDRRTGKVSLFFGPRLVNNANAICFDRASGNGDVVVGSGPVHRFDRSGRMLSSIGNLPWNNTGMCFDRGRNIVTLRLGSPNKWAIRLDFPNRTGYAYVVGLSATGFTPGIAVDSRTIPLVPDALLQLSLGGSLGSLLTGGSGVLGFGGRATATLDLSRFGKQLKGARIWIAAAVLHWRAPSGIDTISKPVILPLD